MSLYICIKCKQIHYKAEACSICKRPLERITGEVKLKPKFKDPVPVSHDSDWLFLDEVNPCGQCGQELNSAGDCERCRQ